jgi:hypothetical protein
MYDDNGSGLAELSPGSDEHNAGGRLARCR